MRSLPIGLECLVGIPVQVLSLVRHPKSARIPRGFIRSVLLSTDYVPESIVADIQRTWGCRVYQHYGMTEMGYGGGVECDAHDGYHLREADLFVEIVDPATGRALPDGVSGEVVVTTLTRRAMPLIRYRTGDMARFLPEYCPCGSTLRRLEQGAGPAGERGGAGAVEPASHGGSGRGDFRHPGGPQFPGGADPRQRLQPAEPNGPLRPLPVSGHPGRRA